MSRWTKWLWVGMLFLALCACTGSGYLTPTPRSVQTTEDITGHYTVRGVDRDGQKYTGELTITRQGDVYAVVWTIGQMQFEGVGILEGEVLAVTWDAGGLPGLVVYRVTQPGVLEGRWTVLGEEVIMTEQAKRD